MLHIKVHFTKPFNYTIISPNKTELGIGYFHFDFCFFSIKFKKPKMFKSIVTLYATISAAKTRVWCMWSGRAPCNVPTPQGWFVALLSHYIYSFEFKCIQNNKIRRFRTSLRPTEATEIQRLYFPIKWTQTYKHTYTCVQTHTHTHTRAHMSTNINT